MDEPKKSLAPAISSLLQGQKNVRTCSFEIAIALSGNPKTWASSLQDMGFEQLSVLPARLEATKVQSLDFNANAHQYIKFEISQKKLIAHYTVLEGQLPQRRKIEAARLAFLIIASIGKFESGEGFAAFLPSCLDEALSLLSADTDIILAQNHDLAKLVQELQERIQTLYAQREEMASRAISDAKKIEALESKLKSLERIPDSAVDELVLSWLSSHGGEINIAAFGAQNSIAPSRIEQSLQKLCKAGKIARVLE